MTSASRAASDLIAAILNHGKSVYYIAKLMRRQVTQIQRMKATGRCQPHELEMLREILAELTNTATV